MDWIWTHDGIILFFEEVEHYCFDHLDVVVNGVDLVVSLHGLKGYIWL